MITYLLSSLIYLVVQELLNIFMYFERIKLNTFSFHNSYFISPAISAVLVLISYLILRRIYHPHEEHYLLHAISWFFLFIPQIIPLFLAGLNIIYATWVFILATTATTTVIFQDLALVHVDNVSRNEMKFIYDELKFYFDKLSLAWLTLGSIMAVGMTIILTAPMTSFNMEYDERMFWALYTTFCFITVTLLVVIFIIYPIFKNIRKVRGVILGEKKDVTTSDNNG